MRVPEDNAGRARTAWSTEATAGDYPSFSAWTAQAFLDAAQRSEAIHNVGRPYRATPAGVIPTGRPVR